MNPQDTPICAVLLGNADTEAKAKEVAQNMQGCPYVVHYTAAGTLIIGVFVLPASKRWWIEYPQEHPELLGLDNVVVMITDRILAESSWLQGIVQPVAEIPPCKTDCGTCPQYHVRCSGCPATIYYSQ